MDAGRESVGLAIPFTAGVAAASYSLKTFCIGRSVIETTASVTVALTILLICALWYCINAGPSCMVHSRRAICSVIGKWLTASGGKAVRRMLLLTAGTATALINAIPHISAPETPGIAEICAVHLKSLIDSIPFADAGSNALVKAFLTGDQRDLGTGIRDAFRDSGASHLLALSGMHLSIIYLVVSRILSFLGNTRCVRICRSAVIVAGSAFFTVMTGAAPSLVRAFFFILLRECALLTGRSRDSINIFCIALLIQLAITPSAVTSAGFQLSYLAMCGIYFLYPTLRDIYPANVPVLKKIWDSAAMSIACQAFTGPLAWVLFGSAPVYFIITNLIAVPLTSALMPVALAAVFLDSFGMCPGFLAGGIDLCCMAVIRSLEIICSLP